jgi:hypothetical protein
MLGSLKTSDQISFEGDMSCMHAQHLWSDVGSLQWAMGSLLQRGAHFGQGVMYLWTNVSHGNASEADRSSPPPIRLQDRSMAL